LDRGGGEPLDGHPLVLFLTGARPRFVDTVIDRCSECGFQPQIAQEVGDAVTGVALGAGGLRCMPGARIVLHTAVPGVLYRQLIETPPNFFDVQKGRKCECADMVGVCSA
jgi:LysR family transcriptional regulator, benzoate and cis,cis-muconate-responsive activator of ben and cat genes